MIWIYGMKQTIVLASDKIRRCYSTDDHKHHANGYGNFISI